MSFQAAELVATIQLGGVDKADRDLDRFRGKLEQTDSAATKAGRAAKQALEGAAVATGVAATAATALVASLFSTGVAYNQLQQTSRAALRTLLGGAEAANAQMDKLDAFARTSPFSKSVFISAQQQLIGFGFEAQKVIPILNAVQNATAAVGGSNQQISEIVSILAKIRSSGKLTAEDLNMLGERGLDAATLLGQGFGKSAAEIRSSITKGTLDAGQAVDVLVEQMQTKFGGAAANVKETFAGTVDRIKAASRDIGAALAEPFVSKNGGGLFVTWGNQVADVMRAVESHTAPVVSMLVGRAMPAFADITESLDRARVQIRAWDSSQLEQGLNVIAANGPAIAGVAGAVLGVNSQLLASIPILGRFVPAFGPVAGALGAAALASPELRKELGALLGELKPLLPVAGDVARVFSGALNAALPLVSGGIRGVVAIAGPLVDILGDVPAPLIATAAAGIAVFTAMKSGEPALQGFVDGIRRIGEQHAVQAALAGMDGNTSALAGSFGIAGKAATGLGNSIKAAFVANPVGLIILGVSTAAAILTAALSAQAEEAKATTDRIDGYRETLTATGEVTSATTDKIRKSIQEFAAVETNLFTSGSITSAKDWVDSVGGADKALSKFGVTSGTVADAVRDGGESYDLLLTSLRDYGSETEKINTTGGVKDQLTASANAANLLRDSIVEQRAAMLLAAQIQADYNDRMREAAASMTEAERSNTRMNEALTIARDVSRDATERLNGLKLALDELNGGTKSQADLTQELNDQIRSLEGAFAAVDAGGNKLANTLVMANGEIDTSTSAGSLLRTQVMGLRDDYLDAMRAAHDAAVANGENGLSMDQARAVAGPYQQALRDAAAAAGVADEKVGALVTTMLETPEVVAYTFTDDGTIDAQKIKLLDVAQQILATPDKEFQVTSDDFPGLMEALRILGVNITTLPPGQVKVARDDGSFATVEQQLNDLARTRTVMLSINQKLAGDTSTYTPTGILKRAGGGPVQGAGSNTSDSIFARLSNDEHVWTASETRGAGGHGQVAALRAAARSGRLGDLLPGFADGGPVLRIDRLPDLTVQRLPALGGASGAGSAGRAQRVDNSLHVTMNATPEAGIPLITQVMGVVRRLQARQARKG